MSRKLKIKIGQEEFEAITLDQAPKTVESFLKYLPFEGETYHAAWAGDSIVYRFPLEKVSTVPPENQSIYGFAGDMVWFPRPTHHELQIVHGYAQFRWRTGPMVCNVFGRILSRLPELNKVCETTRREGIKKLNITAL